MIEKGNSIGWEAMLTTPYSKRRMLQHVNTTESENEEITELSRNAESRCMLGSWPIRVSELWQPCGTVLSLCSIMTEAVLA